MAWLRDILRGSELGVPPKHTKDLDWAIIKPWSSAQTTLSPSSTSALHVLNIDDPQYRAIVFHLIPNQAIESTLIYAA